MDGYYSDYHHGYESNNDWMLIGFESISLGLILMTIIGCIGVVIAIIAGWLMYTWMKSYPQNRQRAKGSGVNRYRHVVANDSDQI